MFIGVHHSSPDSSALEASMSRSALTTVIAAFVLIVNLTPSWGQPVCVAPGCNPTTSDVNNNTAGGNQAAHSVTTGSDNTAFGQSALSKTDTGSFNTAIGYKALSSNSG